MARQPVEQRIHLQSPNAVLVKEAIKDYERRFRDEYEAKLEKSYRLIDELIADKKALTEQCNKLVCDMRQISQKALAKQKLLEEKYVFHVSFRVFLKPDSQVNCRDVGD